MTKRYRTLQKKLRELEASIAALSADNLADVAQQLAFSRKLLSAEVASHPSKPHHLAHISRRLDQLDAVFRHHHHDDFAGNDADGFDAASACSCTDSCLNDDGEGEGDLGSELCEEADEMFYEAAAGGAVEEEERVVVIESEREKGGVEREKAGDCVRGYFGVLCGGLVVGAAVGAVLTRSVMLRFSDCFHYIQHQGFLVPT